MPTTPAKSRHISIRLSAELFARLEAHAAANDETVSQSARRILADGLDPDRASSAGIDDAIAILRRLRRGSTEAAPTAPVAAPVADVPAPVESDAPARTVNVLNAKANLSRLLADVARGEEIVIAHAGTRARLVPADD